MLVGRLVFGGGGPAAFVGCQTMTLEYKPAKMFVRVNRMCKEEYKQRGG